MLLDTTRSVPDPVRYRRRLPINTRCLSPLSQLHECHSGRIAFNEARRGSRDQAVVLATVQDGVAASMRPDASRRDQVRTRIVLDELLSHASMRPGARRRDQNVWRGLPHPNTILLQ